MVNQESKDNNGNDNNRKEIQSDKNETIGRVTEMTTLILLIMKMV